LQGLIKWGIIGIIAWQTQIAISNLSGKITEADIKLKAEGNLTLNHTEPEEKKLITSENTLCTWVVTFALFFGWGGIFYGRKQSRLRKDAIENMYPEKLRLEEELDPNRTSSELTSRGDTKPEDK
jgi:hypothetical protein